MPSLTAVFAVSAIILAGTAIAHPQPCMEGGASSAPILVARRSASAHVKSFDRRAASAGLVRGLHNLFHDDDYECERKCQKDAAGQMVCNDYCEKDRRAASPDDGVECEKECNDDPDDGPLGCIQDCELDRRAVFPPNTDAHLSLHTMSRPQQTSSPQQTASPQHIDVVIVDEKANYGDEYGQAVELSHQVASFSLDARAASPATMPVSFVTTVPVATWRASYSDRLTTATTSSIVLEPTTINIGPVTYPDPTTHTMTETAPPVTVTTSTSTTSTMTATAPPVTIISSTATTATITATAPPVTLVYSVPTTSIITATVPAVTVTQLVPTTASIMATTSSITVMVTTSFAPQPMGPCDAVMGVIDACYTGKMDEFYNCGENDRDCMCINLRAVKGCLTQCPSDKRHAQVQSSMVAACAMATAFPSTRSSATATITTWTQTLVSHTPATTIPPRTMNEVKEKLVIRTQTLSTGGASGLTTTGGMMALMGLGLLL